MAMMRNVLGGCGLGLIGCAAPAAASGFYLQEQAAKEVGRAFSGGAAAADDPSTIFFNPAGMTELRKVELSANGHWLFVRTDQQDRGSTRTAPGVPTQFPVQGTDGGNPFSQPILVPALYASFKMGRAPLWVGLAVNSPFGVKVRYSDDFFGRYDSIKSDLKTVNISPSIAVKLSDAISLGASVNVSLIDVKLRNALPNVSPLLPDGQFNVKGDDWGVGYTVGLLAKTGRWRLGASYRSRVKHRLDGYTETTGLLGPLAGANGTRFATAPITLPDSATLSVTYGVGQKLRLMGTAKWFNWSVFREIRIEPFGGAAIVSPQNYRDVFSGAIGAEADVSRRLTLRLGTLYDPTPTRDGFRTTRVPDGDRWWATGGATFRLTPMIEANLSYAHIFVSSEPIDRADPFFEGTPAAIGTTTRALNSGAGDEVAAALTWRL